MVLVGLLTGGLGLAAPAGAAPVGGSAVGGSAVGGSAGGGSAGGRSASGDSAGGSRPPSPAAGRRAAWRFDASAATMADVGRVVGADRLHRAGIDGSGVGVALVDTGVVAVAGLPGARVVNGPDLSFDGQTDHLRHQDTYGHGTHLAGIIAGAPAADGSGFGGVAPGATLTSVKVGAAGGIADVGQVIAAIDWVVAHRDDDPDRPIRVLNLAYGTDGTQDYRIDPLTHAVENAWRAGIVVVVAAGNGGRAAPRLANPAYDPYVLAVGAADPHGTTRTGDDTVTDFSSRGDAARRVDLVAPGRSIVSLRDPGSYVDEMYPDARVGARYTKGSGTSQAAAVVSGAVALLLQRRPGLTPDQVKGLLTGTAAHLPHADEAGRGAGGLDVYRASRTVRPTFRQTWAPSTGLGSLEAARGSVHVALDGVALTGEQNPWSGLSWSGLSWSGLSWSGLSWSGLSWSGLSWSGLSWSGEVWG
jgi:serine protease AprX